MLRFSVAPCDALTRRRKDVDGNGESLCSKLRFAFHPCATATEPQRTTGQRSATQSANSPRGKHAATTKQDPLGTVEEVGGNMPRRTHTTPLTRTFGARMRDLRLESGMSLGQLSEKTGIGKGHLSSIEQGFASITIESIERIAKGLELSPAMLLAFPETDEYGKVLDLMRQLPVTRLKPLRRLLKQWVEEYERGERCKTR